MPVERSPAKKSTVVEHRSSGVKETWEIQMASADARVLIIGNSNMCQAAHIPIPPDWEIHALVGAKFQNVLNVLKKFVPSPKLKYIIIAVGKNHRDHSPMVYADIVKTINEHLQSVRVKYAFIGVSVPSTVKRPTGRKHPKAQQDVEVSQRRQDVRASATV